MPLIMFEIATASEGVCEVSCNIVIHQFGRLSSIPCPHERVVWMNRHVRPNRTLPGCTIPIRRLDFG